ncbi:hypothetical protein [Thiomicrorhabdus aquaedulcis]|uniref:hypothetical protein n=1 Tax=Thiomicrorhabdus aquaedulcis TaxID=2211106 RepID=UPI001561B832|nr:hypothetical protein [Thiomicrorhabdus aquaedulcis]
MKDGMAQMPNSLQVFQQLGGVVWVTRPGYMASPSTPFAEPLTASLPLVEPVKEPKDLELTSIVLFGAGLDALWQDESALGWQLWQNIMLAFGWDDTQIVFFDTAHLVSEEMMFSTVEEVISLGVEWVLTMDELHEVNESLSEGVAVVSVPSIDDMLGDARAKQLFYTTVRGLI